jgi:hypothetical protein
MVKFFTRFFVVVLIFISFTTTSEAFFGRSIFGGRVTNTKATEIENLENNGYTCEVNGTTISIKPIKGPKSYFIPAGTVAKSKNSIRGNQQIIGRYSENETITCTKNEGEDQQTETVSLPKINIFNVSLR